VDASTEGDWALILAVTAGATALAFALGGAWWLVRELAAQPWAVVERLAAVVTLAVGVWAMCFGMERGR